MKRRIRLFIDGHWFDYPHESTAVFLKGLYTQLLEDNDFEFFMAAHDVEKLKNEFDRSDKITYLRLKSTSKYWRLLVEIPQIIKRNNIDISHFQYISPFHKTSKEIVTIHDLLYRDFKPYFPLWYRLRNDIFFKRSAKRADLVTSVSNYSLHAIHRHFKIPYSKMSLVPNGISEDYFEAPMFLDVRKKYDMENYIVCVSRIEPRKNHLLLVRAYHELALSEKNVKLVFVGRQDIHVKELDDYLNSLPPDVSQCIIHLTNINSMELKNLYQQASVVVYPSLGEGFGIPPLEAAALGARVLCSNTTAMADFTFFKNSFFDPHNLEELKTKLISKLNVEDDEQPLHTLQEIRMKYDWKPISKSFAAQVKRLFF